MGRIRDFLWSSNRRRVLTTAVLAASTLSSLAQHQDGVWPLWTTRTGTSSGIISALYVDMRPGSKHYGPIVAPLVVQNGEVQGPVLSIFSTASEGITKGVEFAVLGNICPGDTERLREDRHTVYGVQLAIIVNQAHRVHGAQVSIDNWNATGCNAQVGVYNNQSPNDDTNARSILLGLHLTNPPIEKTAKDYVSPLKDDPL